MSSYEQVKTVSKQVAARAEQELTKQFGDEFEFKCTVSATPKSVHGIRVRAETGKAPVTVPLRGHTVSAPANGK